MFEGYEKTAKAAEVKAVEKAGLHSKRVPGKWALGYKRGGAAYKQDTDTVKPDKPKSRLNRRADSPSKAKAPGRLTFLYAATENDQAGSPGEVVIVKHRVIRQTAGKIYVDREPFRENEWQNRDEGTLKPSKTRSLAVDREVLRRERRFPHRGLYFYASEEQGIQGVHADLTARHAWCSTLDISFPCSAKSIKAAYRRLAREKHPDAGGSQAEFQTVERAYREALAYFSSLDDS